MDEYCKKYCINSYSYLKEGSSMSTSQHIFLNNSYTNIESANSSNINQHGSTITSSSPPLSQFLKIRSLVDRGVKFIEKKLNLQDFLLQTNVIINNLTSFNSIHSSYGNQPFSGFGFNSFNPFGLQANSSFTSNSTYTYAEYISATISSLYSSTSAPTPR